MIKKITDNVWKVDCDSNVYLLEKEKTLIDTGRRSKRNILVQFLSKVIDFVDIRIVIFTHLHHDHIANFDLFLNAKFYASAEEIEDFKKNPLGSVLDKNTLERFKDVKLLPLSMLPKVFDDLVIIKTPSHTRGGVCLLYDHKILFSGDTIFDTCIGRTDLPTSAPDKVQESLNKLVSFNHKILCPGHDY